MLTCDVRGRRIIRREECNSTRGYIHQRWTGRAPTPKQSAHRDGICLFLFLRTLFLNFQRGFPFLLGNFGSRLFCLLRQLPRIALDFRLDTFLKSQNQQNNSISQSNVATYHSNCAIFHRRCHVASTFSYPAPHPHPHPHPHQSHQRPPPIASSDAVTSFFTFPPTFFARLLAPSP